MSNLISVSKAIDEIKQGKLLIIVDDQKRENEGDFYISADNVTVQSIMTMVRFGGGLVCTAITKQQVVRLELPLMVPLLENNEKTKVNFTISVDAKEAISTGVSAYDRLKTIKILANSKSLPSDLTRPGHVFGLVAKNGGVLERDGHTEAAVDLARLVGFTPAGVICEIVGKSGKMAKLPELIKLSRRLNIKIISIKDLIAFLKKNPLERLEGDKEIIKTAASELPTEYGDFRLIIYKSVIDSREHVALVKGDVKDTVLLRIHSQCLTGDTLLSLKCDCREQLHQSIQLINKNGNGVILYLNQEGRGIGLTNKIKAYSLQDRGHDTVEANESLGFPIDARQYKIAADILKDLGVSRINLLTNNPDKEKQLMEFGIEITKTTPLEIKPNKTNKHYLITKKQKLAHRLRLV
ncbi:MAG: bifunctional 3,4-dihydroxy-2-butanone 4-phosphate synthase/GTP cyclohydrolase II [Candidatus Levybacteria bacterium RIFCSPHIGHO2_12_FULL_38_12]|nr:MAG: bifunctional 3,4-dihydroxy-2-butanone 4-phosphate synthase/GTP cyclohydrolase II [Candidatus Levybacteria bacterium RIFCSPHIGHO2_01_FULL_38_12]OGH22260.1 MAG: bifunctional 3,4-dihydroxy-2-butanone 4-phosphate synthase/GTP cyclohydrolase II [Candidatus Levybacteria bacterium RIFCSPHIGHO2_02_FULL_37_18]OGH22679.1 MAG: bifunctional 3,4-dihydroxy-2-butanone 4-phosphate synthase/GTP cyclohydrolase II [Candidatus Levybacteria bacterium RIFCSPHIGHO2_12_FULL_38_12]OGH33515.1 MAG: bifunctional 3,